MKELQEIWDNLPEKPISEDRVDAIVSRKSAYELDRFRKILMIELYASGLLLILFIPMGTFIRNELLFIILFTIAIATLLNLYTIYRLKKINLKRDVRTYLKSAIKFLKTFILHFILSIQVVGIITIYVLKTYLFPSQTWDTWLLSESGIFSILLLAFIEIILVVYARVFYFKRVFSLNKLLKDLGD